MATVNKPEIGLKML